MQGCSDELRGLSWLLEFESEALREASVVVEVSIDEGDCAEGTPKLGWTRVGMAGGMPRLGAGRYALKARGRDAECRVIAAGCEEVRLPEDGGAAVRVLMRASAGAALCPLRECEQGLCRGELDAGFDGGLDAGEDADSPRGDGSAPIDASLDAATLDATPIDAGQLDSSLDSGRDADLDACGSAGCSPPPVRQVAPLAGSLSTSLRPTFHWETRGSPSGVYLDVCGDPHCSSLPMSFDVTGATSHRVPTALPAGVHFWRLRSVGPVHLTTTWPIRIPAGLGATSIDRGRDAFLDVDNDGYLDTVVGAADDVSPLGAGEVYLYRGSSTGPRTATPTILSGPGGPDSSFGRALGPAGDVNGDGFVDLIVGAPRTRVGGELVGRAYVYYGSASGLVTEAPTVLSPSVDARLARFGHSVSFAGDLDHDGYAEVIVGAPGNGDGAGSGRAYVYYGSSAGLSSTPRTILSPPPSQGSFGWSIVGGVDTDADGNLEVAVSALFDAEDGGGRVFIHEASGGALLPTARNKLRASEGGTAFGYSLAAGDINADGFEDLLIGDYLAMEWRGAVYTYTGAAAGPSFSNIRFGTLVMGNFGVTVASGDVDLDGRDDLITSAISESASGGAVDYTGRGYVYFSLGTSYTTPVIIPAPSDVAEFGFGLGPSRDIEADGIAEVLIGAPSSDDDLGRIFVLHVSRAPMGYFLMTTVAGPSMDSRFGTHIGG